MSEGMEIEDELIGEAVRERETQCESLLNGSKHTITRPDGTQYRPYARILVQPTILEVARQYMRNFQEWLRAENADDPVEELAEENERKARTRLLGELRKMEEACGELRMRLLRVGEPLSEDALKYLNWEVRKSQCRIDDFVRKLLDELDENGKEACDEGE